MLSLGNAPDLRGSQRGEHPSARFIKKATIAVKIFTQERAEF